MSRCVIWFKFKSFHFIRNWSNTLQFHTHFLQREPKSKCYSITCVAIVANSSCVSCWWSLVGIGLNLDDLESGRTGAIYAPVSFKCGKTVCGSDSIGASIAASYEPYEGSGEGPLEFNKIIFIRIWLFGVVDVVVLDHDVKHFHCWMATTCAARHSSVQVDLYLDCRAAMSMGIVRIPCRCWSCLWYFWWPPICCRDELPIWFHFQPFETLIERPHDVCPVHRNLRFSLWHRHVAVHLVPDYPFAPKCIQVNAKANEWVRRRKIKTKLFRKEFDSNVLVIFSFRVNFWRENSDHFHFNFLGREKNCNFAATPFERRRQFEFHLSTPFTIVSDPWKHIFERVYCPFQGFAFVQSSSHTILNRCEYF